MLVNCAQIRYHEKKEREHRSNMKKKTGYISNAIIIMANAAVILVGAFFF
ncbi:MAG: hypothetical protein K2H40_15495 [Lachnospiraceae bacterium]|nr:hypothetical protein [Lachnospiraceae bacterium]